MFARLIISQHHQINRSLPCPSTRIVLAQNWCALAVVNSHRCASMPRNPNHIILLEVGRLPRDGSEPHGQQPRPASTTTPDRDLSFAASLLGRIGERHARCCDCCMPSAHNHPKPASRRIVTTPRPHGIVAISVSLLTVTALRTSWSWSWHQFGFHSASRWLGLTLACIIVSCIIGLCSLLHSQRSKRTRRRLSSVEVAIHDLISD
jgi:hypothetical protein